MNRDQLSQVPARETIQVAYAALSGAQSHPAAMQVAAYGVLFVEACRALRLDVSQQIDAASRIARHAEDNYSVELQALRQFIRQELA